MLTDFSAIYYKELSSRLPRQLQNLEYLLLPVNVTAEFKKDLQRFKPLKKPLIYSYKDIPKDNFTRIYIEKLKEQLQPKYFFREFKQFKENKLNIALNLETSNLLVIDIDNADITFTQLNAILKQSSGIRKENLEKFLHMIKNTFSVKSGNNGYHYYFKFNSEDEPLIKKKVKSFSVDKVLTKEEIFKINSILPKQYSISNRLTIDILVNTGYCITPPSRFKFLDPQFKTEKENQYLVQNDLEISVLDHKLILELFNFEDTENISVSNNQVFTESLKPKFESKYSHIVKQLTETNLNHYLEDPLLLSDKRIRIIKSKFKASKYTPDLTVNIIRRRIKQLIEEEYFNQNGYDFMLKNILDDYKGMNLYAYNKKEQLSYNLIPNAFKILLSSNYDKNDRSGFEYAFLTSQISIGLNPNILWEYIDRYFSKNSKIKHKSYFNQLYNKITSNQFEIKSNSPFIPIAIFLETARKIDFRYYFGKSADSCALVFLALIERKMKIANDSNNLWQLTHESYNNLSLICRLDPKTIKSSLRRLHNEKFIKLKRKKTKIRISEFSKKEIELFNIIINTEKKYKTQELEYYICDSLPELKSINQISKIGSQTYSRLLLNPGKTLNEIYNYFPGVSNPHGTIKPKIMKLESLGFLEYFEEDKTYYPSIRNLYSKLLYAKRLEYVEKIIRLRFKRYANKQNKESIDLLISVPQKDKEIIFQSIRNRTRKKIYKKPMNVNLQKALEMRERKEKFAKGNR